MCIHRKIRLPRCATLLHALHACVFGGEFRGPPGYRIVEILRLDFSSLCLPISPLCSLLGGCFQYFGHVLALSVDDTHTRIIIIIVFSSCSRVRVASLCDFSARACGRSSRSPTSARCPTLSTRRALLACVRRVSDRRPTGVVGKKGTTTDVEDRK